MNESKNNSFKWMYINEEILFVHRVNCHSSTTYFPFMMMYNCEQLLNIDIKHELTFS